MFMIQKLLCVRTHPEIPTNERKPTIGSREAASGKAGQALFAAQCRGSG